VAEDVGRSKDVAEGTLDTFALELLLAYGFCDCRCSLSLSALFISNNSFDASIDNALSSEV
jgi:hypothetical protein